MRISDWSSDVCSSDLNIEGTTLREEVVVLGAHLDSINADGGGSPGQAAPGADDDASGIAVLTETLRIALASGWRPQRTVKFMGYAAEEVGLRGSNAIAQSHRQAGVDVVAVLQVDMTNYKAGPRSEEHTSELQALMRISYAIFRLKKKKQ